MSSLPVPVSPRISTVELLRATFLTIAEHLLQRAARADDAVEVVDVLLLVAQVLHLVLEMAELDRLLDLELHLLDFERLLHEVERADLHRLDGRVDRAERRHQDHRRARLNRSRRAQHVHAVGAAHPKVGQHDVELAVLQPLDRDRAVGASSTSWPALASARTRPLRSES